MPPEAPPIVAEAAAEVPAPVAQAPAAPAPASQPPSPSPSPSPGPSAAAPSAAGAPSVPPRRVSSPPRPATATIPRVYADDLSAKFGDESSVRTRPSAAKGLVATVAIILVGAMGLGAYYYLSKQRRITEQKIDALLKQVRAEIDHDNFAGYRKACEYGEQIVTELDNSLYSAHAYLAYAYAIRWGEHGEGENVERAAKEHLARAQSAKQEHSHIIAASAYIRFFGGDTKGAEEALEQSVKEHEQKGQKSTLLLGTLGILQMHTGELEKAYQNLKAAQTLSPADPRINAALGDVLRRQGNEFLAYKYYDDALRYERDHAEAQLGVALMFIETGKLEMADRIVKRLLGANPPPSPRQMAVAHLANAILLDEQGKASDAEKEQALAFETDSRNAELYILKARRLVRANKVDDAVASIREAIKRDPRRASFYVELAKVLIAKPGGAKEAVSSMEQALKSMPGSPKLLVLLGDSYRAAEDYERAKESYEKALASSKDKVPEARLALADLARSKKDTAKALELYEKARSEYLSSPKKQAYALTEMGKIFEEQGERKKAFESYRAAVAADPTFAPSIFLSAKLFSLDREKQNRERAFEFLERYLQIDPKGEYAEDARRLLAERRR